MTQTSLLDYRPPSVTGSATSESAAESIAPTAGTLRADVLAWLVANGPATDEEMQRGLAMNPSTQRPRRVELVRAGLVEDTGETRAGKSGRAMTIWRARI